MRGAGGGFLGLAAWAAGNVEEALSTFSEAVRSLHAAGNLVDELDGTVVLADMWVASGRPSRARRLYEQALQTATAGGEPYPRATADLHVGLAELDRELDDLTSAEAHLETARVLGERASITENRHRWYVAMAQVRAAGGDYDTATRLLDQAEALYRHGFYPDVRPIAAMKARVQIAAGDLSSAAAWAEDRGVDVDDDPDYLREYEHLTLARLLLARHRADQHIDEPARRGARSSGPAACRGGEAGRDGSMLEIRVLQALAHHARGDLPQARRRTQPKLCRRRRSRTATSGCTWTRAPRCWPSCTHAAGAAPRQRPDDSSSAPRPPVEAAAEPQQTLVDPLSHRELQVLRLLDSDLTGPQIARELYVSLNTLRTHTKRIFTKLDVTTRAAAVRRAHERGLL